MINLALVGLGNAARNLHLPAIAALSGAKAVAGCDPDPDRRRSAEKDHGLAVFATLEEMLEKAKPDVVVVGSPPALHAAACKLALAAGAHVICEKPFVSSLAEADEIVAAAAAAGRQVALNHEFREMPIFRALRDQIGRPETGPIVFAQVWQLMDLPPWKEPGWRGQMLQRTLYEAGVHLVDLAMALFGEKPRAVTATTSTCGQHEGKTDAVALATLEFSGGRLAQIVQNRLCKGDEQYFEVRAEGTLASLRASYGGRARFSIGMLRALKPHARFEFGAAGTAWREVGTRRFPLGRNPKHPAMVATRIIIEKSLAAFRDGSRPPATAQDGRDVLEVIAACYRSADLGRRVELEGEEARGLDQIRMGGPPAP